MKIMIVEDEENIALSLKRELESWKYETYVVENFNDVIGEFERENPQLILLDINLPYFNGYYWCQEIRKISKVPIIFISSRNENMDIVMAMQLGGDDFITKPLNLTVISAKVQALIRRTYDFITDLFVLNYEEVYLDLRNAELKYREKMVSLTKTESLIMELLFKYQGEFVSREELMENCWQGDDFIDDNTLAVNIMRLRRKLDDLGLNGFIVTKKGVGYALFKKGLNNEKI